MKIKHLLALISGVFMGVATLHAQSTNAAPSVVTAPVTINSSATNATPYYHLIYNPTTKVIVAQPFNTSAVHTPFGLYTATSYAQLQAYASTNALTGLKPQVAGQP